MTTVTYILVDKEYSSVGAAHVAFADQERWIYARRIDYRHCVIVPTLRIVRALYIALSPKIE